VFFNRVNEYKIDGFGIPVSQRAHDNE